MTIVNTLENKGFTLDERLSREPVLPIAIKERTGSVIALKMKPRNANTEFSPAW